MGRRTHTRTGTVITMDYTRGVVRKDHPDHVKLQDEIDWYRLLPVELGDLAPRIVESGLGVQGYEMDLIPGPSMADLWVFGSDGWDFWERALATAGATLDRLHAHPHPGPHDPGAAQQSMYVDKTLERIEQLEPARAALLPEALWRGPRLRDRLLPGLEFVSETLLSTYQQSRLAQPRSQTVLHGDFHFGNLFYRAGSEAVTMIDPRGSFGGISGLYGDPLYDELKLGHSIVGGYDYVSTGSFRVDHVAEEFTLEHLSSSASVETHQQADAWITDRLRSRYSLTEEDLRLGVSMLLLSLASLHGNPSQQIAHLLRGLELYAEAFR